jgi:ABC-type Fe3+-siderophore transport system permease subunit
MLVFRHVLGTVVKVFFKVVFATLIFAAIGAAAVLVVSYVTSGQWPPQSLTIVVVIAIAVLSGYAGGMTVLMGEAVREAIRGIRAVEQDVGDVVSTAEKGISGLEKHL